jgi:hypothetical protein
MGDEGKVEGGGKSADGRTVVEGAGMGETVGAITRDWGERRARLRESCYPGIRTRCLKRLRIWKWLWIATWSYRPDELP